MTESIRRQLVVPPYVSAIYMTVGLGMLATGITLVAASAGVAVTPLLPEAELAEVTPPVPAPAPRAAIAASEEAAPIADEIKLVFRADGASYMKLADLELASDDGDDGVARLPRPRHAAPRYVHEDGMEIALAAVRDEDVPALHRAWLGKRVVVDGTCEATVTGFAFASRLIGETWTAGIEQWDAAAVMKAGAPVLAARLDRCDGTFARDAALAPVVVPELIQDERLAGAARSALIASPVGAGVQRDWDQHYRKYVEGPWWKHVRFTTQVLRHPRTGATLVSVHALSPKGCGEFDADLWGLYRVGADGALSPVRQQTLPHMDWLDRLVDIEGDGELELIGRSWPTNDVVIAGQDGSEIDRLAAPFYGCPC